MLFKLQFNSGDLYYKLHETPLAQKWWYEFSQRTVKDCEIFNPNLHIKNKTSFKNNYNNVVERLEHLIWFLKGNGYKINGEFNKNDAQESLSRLHEHFVAKELDKNNKALHRTFQEYNLLIHWLEANLNFRKSTARLKAYHANIYFENEKKYDILDEDFNFTLDIKNGDITCAYPQTGRSFTDIAATKDYNIPKEQISLHKKWSANCNITFFDPPEKLESSKEYFMLEAKETYNKMKGKKTFGYDFTDKKLAVGWLQLASLIEDGQSIFDNATKIVGWKKC